MRYLLVLLAVLLLVWRWHTARAAALRERKPTAHTRSPIKTDARTMVACAHCGVHVPADEALRSAHGAYCSAAHRQQAEG